MVKTHHTRRDSTGPTITAPSPCTSASTACCRQPRKHYKLRRRLTRSLCPNSACQLKINCLNCRPPDNVFPTDRKARTYISKEDAQIAVDHCIKHHVDPVIRERDWARVDLLGVKSLRFVAKNQGRISKLHGSPIKIERAGLAPVMGMAIYHPAYLMRWGQSKRPVTVIDLKSGLGQSPQFGN